jgi:hypothetical protein
MHSIFLGLRISILSFPRSSSGPVLFSFALNKLFRYSFVNHAVRLITRFHLYYLNTPATHRYNPAKFRQRRCIERSQHLWRWCINIIIVFFEHYPTSRSLYKTQRPAELILSASPKIGTRFPDCAQVSRFRLKTETESVSETLCS